MNVWARRATFHEEMVMSMADLRNINFEALFGQEGRLLQLVTPLGDNLLLPQRVIAHARLGRFYEYTVDCVSGQDDIELKRLIAQGVTLWIQKGDGSYAPVHGYVHTIKRLGSDGQLMYCQLTLAPWLHFLKFRRDARIWQDKTVDGILADVFMQHPQALGNFRFDIREPAPPRSYCTQYETDWHFVQRLMEEEGWYGYHEQLADGSGHVLVITDSTYQLPPIAQQFIEFHCAGTSDEVNKIVHWSAERTLASTQFTSCTNDYKTASLSNQSNTQVHADHGDLPAQLEMYQYTGAYTYGSREQGARQTRLRVEQWESGMKRFTAVSGVRALPVGGWFVLEGHPAHQDDSAEDREFVVVSVEWCIENNLPLSSQVKDFPGSLMTRAEALKAAMGRDMPNMAVQAMGTGGNQHTGHCFNRMEVQRRKVPFRSPVEHIKPVLHPQTAIVVGPLDEEIHTDYLNRVKVQFRWDRLNPGDERASCWVRVSYPNAGQGWGALSVPRIGQEVIVTFLDGDVDRPVVTGRLYNEDQAPGWHTDGKLSGYKSKEYRGKGFNQLVLDDATNKNGVRLYSTKTNAQLNLGYLVSQQGNKRSGFYGAGFSLSTDDYGAIVTHKGLYLSTFGRPGPQGTQLDATEATTQLKASALLGKNLSATAVKAGADALAQDDITHFVDATQERFDGPGEGSANRFKEALLLAASPAGIGLTSAKGVHVHAGTDVTMSSGSDTNLAVGKNLLASVAGKISLFAYNAGIKLFAGRGKVAIQSQGDDLDLIAEKVVRLLSTTARIEIHAKDEVMISAGGSFIKLDASGISNGTPGAWIAHAATHSMPGPARQPYVMPHVLKPELQPNELEFRHLTDWGEPLAGAAYKATLSDGSVRTGLLDALGVARLNGLPQGVGAKIEYDYQPLPASSTVASELHEDVHELLNWMPRKAIGKGTA